MNIHHDLEKIKLVALHYAKEHKCNYNIILLNPDKNGEFNPLISTYEFVLNSYFDKPRENAIILFHTDELLRNEDVPFDEEYTPPTFLDFKNYNFIDKSIHDLFPPRPPQYKRAFSKISRNSICNCGSGKKYKRCCLS